MIIEQQNEEQPIKQTDGTPANQEKTNGQPQVIELQPEEMEKVIANTRSQSVCSVFFGLLDFGLVLGALIALPSECDATNLKDYFIIALSLTIFKLFYSCYQIHITSNELQHLKAEGKNHKLTHDPKSFARSQTYVSSIKKNNTCFALVSYLLVLFELGYFIYANIVLYSDMSSVCKIGEPQYDYTWGIALYFLIERYIGIGVPILMFLCSLCCLPCLAMFGLAALEIENQQQQLQQQQQPQQLESKKEDPPQQEIKVEIQIQDYDIVKDRITDENMCAICVQEFKIGQAIQRLKCDRDHAFHNECIMEWMKTHSECPICKNQIYQQNNQKMIASL